MKFKGIVIKHHDYNYDKSIYILFWLLLETFKDKPKLNQPSRKIRCLWLLFPKGLDLRLYLLST
jgi:hypothetical protein